MNKFYICGLGPGHPDYILPKVTKIINHSDMIIGGVRHTSGAYAEGKQIENIEGRITELPDLIKRNRDNLVICVLVSGDTGFYSLLKYLSKNFEDDEYEVVPGISSIQYMFSKIKRYYQNQYIGSVHGRDLEVMEIIRNNRFTGLLTDAKQTPAKLAEAIVDQEDLLTEDFKLHVGENLSYDNEKITVGTALAIKEMTFDTLSVVIIENLKEES